MKKICLFCLLCFTMLLMMSQNSYASDVHLPKGINYLNLSNFEMLPGTDRKGNTLEPIYIKKNVTYTIALSAMFVGQNFDYMDQVEIRLYDEEDIMEVLKSFEIDHNKSICYVEFSINTNWLHIENLPLTIDPFYEAIMYEGTYQDFPGFHPYIDKDEQMSYHGYLPIDYDDLKSLETIKTYIDAKNYRNDSITFEVISDTYTSSLKHPGIYEILFQTTSNQITKPLFLEIQVFDLTAPVITSESHLEIPLAEKWSLSQIKSGIVVSDNVDTLHANDLTIIEDTYSTATTVGDYHITFKIQDQSGNESSKRLDIQLVDRKPPVITGPSDIYVYTTDPVMTIESILAKYTVYDDVDGSNVGINVGHHGYTSHDVPGIYQIFLIASDYQGNTTNFGLQIHVIENRGPSFEMTEHIMPASIKETLTETEIIDWFKNQALSQGHHVSFVKVRLNEYEGHETSKGQYYVYLDYELEGESYLTRVLIDVEGDKEPLISKAMVITISTLGILFTAWIVIKKKK